MLFQPTLSESFGAIEQNITGRLGSSSFGTTITPDTVGKGAWAQMIAATTSDSYGIWVFVNNNTAGATNRGTLIDIGVGPSGSELVLVPNLMAGNLPNVNLCSLTYFFPVFIPAGSRVSARAQSTVVTGFQCLMQLQQKPVNAEAAKTAAYIETVGVVSGTAGSPVTSGTTAEGAWTSIGTTTRSAWHWQLGLQVDVVDTGWGNNTYGIDMAVGDATNKEIILQERIIQMTGGEELRGGPPSLPVRRFIPAGSELFVRAQSNLGEDLLQFIAYGAGG